MKFLPLYVFFGLLFSSSLTFSQSLTVEVEYEFCGSLFPTENVSVSFCPTQIRPGEGCAVYETDENGIVGPVSVGGIPNEGSNLVWIRVQGFNSSPSYYVYNVWTQPPSSYQFTIPADEYLSSLSPVLPIIGDCQNGDPAPVSLPPDSNVAIGFCDTTDNPFISWDVLDFYGLNFTDNDYLEFPGCVRMELYEANENDSIINPTPVYTSSTSDSVSRTSYWSCDDGIKWWLPELEDGHYVTEIQLGCCSPEFEQGFGDVALTITGSFTYVTQPAEVDVDFDFGVSNQIEQILNDSPIDGQIPRATSRPGPEIGPLLSRFTNANSTGETNYIQSYTYALWEVDCSGPESPVLIVSYTAAPVNGGQPENIDFASILELDSVGGDYFINNREGCYKATLTANNICDTITASGYFQITDQCTFCRKASDKHEESKVRVFPTLVNDNINLLFKNVKRANAQLQVFNSIGLLVKQFEIGRVEPEQSSIMSLSDLTSGVYLYRVLIDDKVVGHGKLIKH